MQKHFRGSARRAAPHNKKSFHGNSNSRVGRRQSPSANVPIRHYINKGMPVMAPETASIEHMFADFAFHPSLAKNLLAKGYDTPTPIQDKAIKPLIDGRDVVGLANTGTGKTAAFVLPIIHQQLQQKSLNGALIITPTRELAHQVSDEFRSFARGTGLFSVVCVGGENIHRQKQELRRGVNVIIGTPGRLKDLLKQGELKLDNTKTLVLDEADQMFDMGFLPDMRFIMQALPASKQTVCFSATMTPAVKQLLSDIQNNALTISTQAKITSEHIDQNVIPANTAEEKMQTIQQLLDHQSYDKILIFGETKRGVQRIADNLMRRGYQAQAIHGNKTQSQRRRALKIFKQSDDAILVATDVAARGLDIPNVHLVVNYDRPQTHDTYIHRIGRTGRAGQSGVARTFVLRSDFAAL